ncbi:hypothetical protein BC827DRAFT_719991 [Russula dissimulans]|nr:hypothetical protein BC827DRAFT_719991 [Russula dissimulans]
MSGDLQQNVTNYPYHATVPPSTVPPVPHNQTAAPRDCVIPPSSQIPQDNLFQVPLPPTAYPTYREAPHTSYPQQYGSLTSNDNAAPVHRAPYPLEQPTNIAPAPARGLAHATAYGPPSLDIPFRGVAENVPVPLGVYTNGAMQDFNDAGYNPAVLGTLMANIYRDLAVRFINNPQSTIVMMRMESPQNSTGRSKVTIELEVIDLARRG